MARVVWRRIPKGVRRLVIAVTVGPALTLVVCGAAAAAPSPGLYEGHLANGITVAVTVKGSGADALVTRTGAICQSVGDQFVDNSGAIIIGGDRRGAYQYRLARDGSFGDKISYADDNRMGGRLDGTTGTVSISRNSFVVRGCDSAHDPEGTGVGAGEGYPVAVSRIGPGRPSPTDGLWTRQEPGGDPGTFSVWGGGAFVGDFDGSPYIGQEDQPQCQITPADLNDGAAIAATGAFTLPWDTTAGLSGFDPVTPTNGVLGGSSGSWTYELDSPYITDADLSQCAAPEPTTVPVALTTPTKVDKPFSAPRPVSPVPTGGTAASTRCPNGEFKTTAGQFVLCTSAKPRVSGGTATLTGRVTINGFLFAEVDSLQVGLRDGRLHSDGDVTFGAIVSGYDLTLGRVPLDLQSGRLSHISLPGLKSGLRLGGLKVGFSRLGGTPPTVTIDLAAGSISVSAAVTDTVAQTTLSLEGALGISGKGVTVDLTSKGFTIPIRIAGRQLFELKSLDFHYSQPDDSWSLGGDADVSLPGGFGAEASASGAVKHGRFDALSLKLDVTGGAGIPGPFGTFVSGGSFGLAGVAGGLGNSTISLGLDGGWPFEVKRAVGIGFEGTGSFDVADLRLTLGATATVTADDVQLANGKATLTVDFDQPMFELDTDVDVLDIIHGKTALRIDGRHFLSQGELTVEFGPDSPPIKFIDDHWIFGPFIDPPSHIGPLASAQAILSDLGAGVRAQLSVWKLKFGATVMKRWDGPLQYDIGFGETEQLSGLTPSVTGDSRPAARRRSASVVVGHGRQALVITGSGSATGRLALRDPRGHLVVDTARVHAARAVRDHGRVLVGRRGDQGGIIVRAPRPGRWHVVASGAAPFTRVTATAVAPRSAGLGRVRSVMPRRTVRPGQVLRLRLDVPHGTTIQLRASAARRGHDAGVPLGVVHRRRARVRVPAGYSGRRLALVAVTRRHGVPVGVTRSARVLRVIHRGLGRPRHLRVRLGAHRTTVRFGRVHGAARYIVTVSVRGHRYETVAHGTRLRLRIPTRGARVTVAVSAVSATTSRVGPAARLTRRPRHHRHHQRRHQPRRGRSG
jgi:hypothetical protein